MENEKQKRRSYFSHFGIRQVCDLVLIAAAIVLIVGMFVEPVWVALVGFSLFILGAVIAIVRMIMIMSGRISRTSPEFRNAVINIVIMTLVLGLSIFGLIYNCMFML